MKQIKKRDGRIVQFNPVKIENAVQKAFMAVDGNLTEYADTKAAAIANYIEGVLTEHPEEIYTVEQIQDMVVHGLMNLKKKEYADAYIDYRANRTKIRNWNNQLTEIIRSKIFATNIEMQNANVDETSFGGRRGEAMSAYMTQFAIDNILSPMARENHLGNRIYEHDMDFYAVGAHNCLSIPFDYLLAHGFNTRQSDVRPAKSINTAFQLIAVLFQLQSLQQFGGCSATHLDWTMVPYTRKSFFKHWRDGRKYLLGDKNADDLVFFSDKAITDEYYRDNDAVYNYAMDMTERELKQAVEGMYHNLNTLQSRSGNQLPFTSINFGTCTLPEGRMVIKALLNGSLAGVGKHHLTPIFPCSIFQLMKGVNRKPGDPNYDLFQLALKSTAQRLYPNYANVDWSGNAGYDRNDPKTYFSTMGKRKLQLM